MLPAMLHAQAYERIAVVNVDSMRSSRDIYGAAQRWFVDTFRDADEVIQLRDTVMHTIVGKGSFRYEPTILNSSQGRLGVMRFTIEVGCREGRYRVRLYDFVHEAVSGLGPILADSLQCGDGVSYRMMNGKPTKFLGRVCIEEVWPQIHATETALLGSLKAAMDKKDRPSDW